MVLLLLRMELELLLMVNMQNSVHTWKTHDMETHFDYFLFPFEVDSQTTGQTKLSNEHNHLYFRQSH